MISVKACVAERKPTAMPPKLFGAAPCQAKTGNGARLPLPLNATRWGEPVALLLMLAVPL